ncbi:hypothetical protein GGR57DRAFT_477614 [Xylariaceae sp. FL1272]|nr:hypothetical protein GGR57DRAFT_477614 [Xylariaceae sp. FL1272]
MAFKDISRIWSIRRTSYQVVGSSEDLLEKANVESDFETYRAAVVASYRRLVAFLSCAIVLLTIGLAISLLTREPTDAQCSAQLSIWSPANEAIEYQLWEPNNAFAHKSPYRGPPTPELESAWTDLWLHGSIRFPEEKLALINRTVDLGNNRTLKSWHDGKGGYHGQLEVHHQLHCLNLVRQYTWRDWYKRHPDIVRMSGDMLSSDIESRMHADHCIEALRIALMCHGDTTPSIGILDPKAPRGQMADFSPLLKCRNFDRIQEWSVENQQNFPPAWDWHPRQKKPDKEMKKPDRIAAEGEEHSA